MSALQLLRDRIPDYGRDIRLNLESVLASQGAPGLSPSQIAGVALACAHAVESPELARAIREDHREALTPEIEEASRAAAAIMAMNNVYYRFVHLAGDPGLSKLPARLRMNVIGRPGIPKIDFELMALAVSAIAGCGSCIQSHVSETRKGGVSDEGIQSAARIASVIQAARRALSIA